LPQDIVFRSATEPFDAGSAEAEEFEPGVPPL
jgi:hypothetical protein